MSLINYTNLEDGTPITANIFNERYGQIIAVLNGGLDQSNFAAGGIPAAALAASVYDQIYPVGSLYFNSINASNPSEVLGFGTWVAFGAGKVIVGYDSTDTDFNAAEKTGGEKTHLLTGAESGEKGHNHTQNAHTHTSTGVVAGVGSDLTQWASSIKSGSVTSSGTTATNNAVAASDASTAHNNLQPFITVYCWKRTS